jgi:uncharacterized membrane protein
MELEYLHPMLVHFPIALTLAGTGLLAWGLVKNRPEMTRAALVVFLLDGALALPTYLTGQVARAVMEDAGSFARALPLLDRHENLGLTSAAALTALALLSGIALWKRRETEARRPWGLLAFALACCALVALTAFQGGRLVFKEGVGVRVAAPGPSP